MIMCPGARATEAKKQKKKEKRSCVDPSRHEFLATPLAEMSSGASLSVCERVTTWPSALSCRGCRAAG